MFFEHGFYRAQRVIRAIARNDAGAASAVQAVDAERLQHVASLFRQIGYGAREAEARAVTVE